MWWKISSKNLLSSLLSLLIVIITEKINFSGLETRTSRWGFGVPITHHHLVNQHSVLPTTHFSVNKLLYSYMSHILCIIFNFCIFFSFWSVWRHESGHLDLPDRFIRTVHVLSCNNPARMSLICFRLKFSQLFPEFQLLPSENSRKFNQFSFNRLLSSYMQYQILL